MEKSKKNKIILFGVAAAIVVCAALISAQAVPSIEKQARGLGPFMAKEFRGIGDFNRMQIRDCNSFPIDANKEQIRERQMETNEQRLHEIKTALGLPDDATNKQAQEALNNWRKENSVLIQASMPMRHNFFGRMRG